MLSEQPKIDVTILEMPEVLSALPQMAHAGDEQCQDACAAIDHKMKVMRHDRSTAICTFCKRQLQQAALGGFAIIIVKTATERKAAAAPICGRCIDARSKVDMHRTFARSIGMKLKAGEELKL